MERQAFFFRRKYECTITYTAIQLFVLIILPNVRVWTTVPYVPDGGGGGGGGGGAVTFDKCIMRLSLLRETPPPRGIERDLTFMKEIAPG